jgi:hypothetical protein
MKFWKKLLIAFGLDFIIFAVSAVMGIHLLGREMCGNDIYKEYVSPNGKLKAVIFQRDCGATTGFSTQISVIAAEDDLKNEAGNIYIIDGQPHLYAPKLSWRNNNELIIYKPINGSEYKAENNWGYLNKVSIIYKKVGN